MYVLDAGIIGSCLLSPTLRPSPPAYGPVNTAILSSHVHSPCHCLKAALHFALGFGNSIQNWFPCLNLSLHQFTLYTVTKISLKSITWSYRFLLQLLVNLLTDCTIRSNFPAWHHWPFVIWMLCIALDMPMSPLEFTLHPPPSFSPVLWFGGGPGWAKALFCLLVAPVRSLNRRIMVGRTIGLWGWVVYPPSASQGITAGIFHPNSHVF